MSLPSFDSVYRAWAFVVVSYIKNHVKLMGFDPSSDDGKRVCSKAYDILHARPELIYAPTQAPDWDSAIGVQFQCHEISTALFESPMGM